MARGVNLVILVGNVGNDPDSATLPDGRCVTTFSLATSESWKDKNTGQQVEKTEWHKIKFFGNQAETIAQYVKKGSKLYIEGSLRTRKWKNKEEQTQSSTEVVGNEFRFLDSINSSSSASPAQAQPSEPAGGFDSFDDDIPF